MKWKGNWWKRIDTCRAESLGCAFKATRNANELYSKIKNEKKSMKWKGEKVMEREKMTGNHKSDKG